ncbi:MULTISPECIES: DNA-3-methyladenine glycosylase I [Clostridium]|jgi:DNA-3-methyladenine glycosylase I|uniref:DNA-3-methyladenine glycosylase I n=4 Tax=Clostridium TaxID=1485 RepID=A0AAE6I3F3_CLOSG|nr:MULTISPECIES: DNA-3-methyladenine glycosylase I [Clostridium]MBE6077183.1 DNA-3-methyladenine glycosylase I [Clostridium lundense]EDU38511.1 DNA-3-methyladenine glycosylase I [Clostridium sporogenes ATCC 15579]MCJ8171172.1 DNA-3-methyladenine glycosylase I [Clostridium botulinum]MCW6078371.1 DNA-3-methyladenine glycosylase I [Clostridium sporogenes]MCW6092688.1 DNA-3-methyladenine glycosylase I [Clostridium sporogenes]
MEEMQYCDWALKNEAEKKYHDEEWGIPVHDDRVLFEFLVLEYMQAGLSWDTILSKRENMSKAFDQFNPLIIANYSESKIEELMQNKGIIRNKLKLKALPVNAKIFLEIQREFGSFSNYLWRYVDDKPIINQWKKSEDVPSNTKLSDIISKDLKRRGFKFVGTTVIYAFLQAAGVVNDHLIYCHKHKNSAISASL